MNDAIPRGEFLNPSDDLPAPAKAVVESLLADVGRAKSTYGEKTPDDVSLADCDLATLRERIINDELQMQQLVEARVRLTAAASLATHCLTAFPYPAALEKARSYDAQIKQQGAQTVLNKYPLLALVFSVKDCIHVAGFATTLGCCSRATTAEESSARVVVEMERLGAIMVAKTAAPQLMMSNTTESPLWGRVRSALDTEAGGSSGGEAALVRYGASQLGIGTDMGGSIRQPACLAELYGLKLHSTHLPWSLPQDFYTGLPNTTIPATAPGFLCRHLSTLRDVCRALSLLPEDVKQKEQQLKWTDQESSSEISSLIHHIQSHIEAQSTKMKSFDCAFWSDVWSSYANEQGFGPARKMLDKDPLIHQSMFDASKLTPTPQTKYDINTIRTDFVKNVVNSPMEATIVMTPTHLLGPCSREVFMQADATGVAEVWCQIFNLLDWPALTIPLPNLTASTRVGCSVSSSQVKEWLDSLSPTLVRDPHDPDTPRPPVLSIQLATLPGNESALLTMAQHLLTLSQSG